MPDTSKMTAAPCALTVHAVQKGISVPTAIDYLPNAGGEIAIRIKNQKGQPLTLAASNTLLTLHIGMSFTPTADAVPPPGWKDAGNVDQAIRLAPIADLTVADQATLELRFTLPELVLDNDQFGTVFFALSAGSEKLGSTELDITHQVKHSVLDETLSILWQTPEGPAPALILYDDQKARLVIKNRRSEPLANGWNSDGRPFIKIQIDRFLPTSGKVMSMEAVLSVPALNGNTANNWSHTAGADYLQVSPVASNMHLLEGGQELQIELSNLVDLIPYGHSQLRIWLKDFPGLPEEVLFLPLRKTWVPDKAVAAYWVNASDQPISQPLVHLGFPRPTELSFAIRRLLPLPPAADGMSPQIDIEVLSRDAKNLALTGTLLGSNCGWESTTSSETQFPLSVGQKTTLKPRKGRTSEVLTENSTLTIKLSGSNQDSIPSLRGVRLTFRGYGVAGENAVTLPIEHTDFKDQNHLRSHRTNELRQGQYLQPGDVLFSANRKHALCFTEDGKVVIQTQEPPNGLEELNNGGALSKALFSQPVTASRIKFRRALYRAKDEKTFVDRLNPFAVELPAVDAAKWLNEKIHSQLSKGVEFSFTVSNEELVGDFAVGKKKELAYELEVDGKAYLGVIPERGELRLARAAINQLYTNPDTDTPIALSLNRNGFLIHHSTDKAGQSKEVVIAPFFATNLPRTTKRLLLSDEGRLVSEAAHIDTGSIVSTDHMDFVICTGQVLKPKGRLMSADGAHEMFYQEDNNIVSYRKSDGAVVWQAEGTYTKDHKPGKLTLTFEGALCTFDDKDTVRWESVPLREHKGCFKYCALSEQGALYLYARDLTTGEIVEKLAVTKKK